jgi:hypothetical protein
MSSDKFTAEFRNWLYYLKFLGFLQSFQAILEQLFEIGYGHFHICLSVDVLIYIEYIFFVE